MVDQHQPVAGGVEAVIALQLAPPGLKHRGRQAGSRELVGQVRHRAEPQEPLGVGGLQAEPHPWLGRLALAGHQGVKDLAPARLRHRSGGQGRAVPAGVGATEHVADTPAGLRDRPLQQARQQGPQLPGTAVVDAQPIAADHQITQIEILDPAALTFLPLAVEAGDRPALGGHLLLLPQQAQAAEDRRIPLAQRRQPALDRPVHRLQSERIATQHTRDQQTDGRRRRG